MTKFVDKKVAKFKSFREYQDSEEYAESKKEIEQKNPEMKEYLVIAALCAFWRDQYLYSLPKSEQKAFLEEEKNVNPENKLDRDLKGGEQKGVEVYTPEEHFEKFGDLEVKSGGSNVFQPLEPKEKDE